MGRAFAPDIPPITLSYWRWLVALIIFIPFSLRHLFREWAVIKANMALLIFMGILGVSGFNSFVYLGLQQTTAMNALLINSFIPILIILLSRIKPGISISWVKLLGILISTFGMILLVVQGNWQKLLSFQVNRGDLWMLLAAFIWARGPGQCGAHSEPRDHTLMRSKVVRISSRDGRVRNGPIRTAYDA